MKKRDSILHGKALMGKFIALAEINSHKELWLKKRGHMNRKGLDKLYNMDKFDAKGTKLDFCNEYQYGKQIKLPYYFGVSCKPNLLDLVHFDFATCPPNLWGLLFIYYFVLLMTTLGSFEYIC